MPSTISKLLECKVLPIRSSIERDKKEKYHCKNQNLNLNTERHDKRACE
jgi:hypothetical protein